MKIILKNHSEQKMVNIFPEVIRNLRTIWTFDGEL